MRLSRSFVIAALVCSALAPTAAFAGDEEAALEKGKKLYDEAVVLLEAKKFAEACPKLEESVRLVPVAVGARLALAECDEGRGRLASALASYRKAQSLASSTGQADREKLAAEQAARLSARVGTLRITLPPADAALDGLAVELDGKALDATTRAAPIQVDAGKHTVRISAKGRAPVTQEAVAVDGKEVAVNVTLAAESSGGSGGTGTGGGSGGGDKPGTGGGPSALFVTGIATGAVGVAALAAGGAMAGLAAGKNDESYKLGCVKGQGCPSGPATEARQAAYGNAAASTGLFIAGGVLAAAGVAVVIAAPKRAKPAAVTGVSLQAGPLGVSVSGSFH